MMSDTVTSVEKHGTENVVDQVEVGKLLVNGGSDRYEVEWDSWLTIQERAVYEPLLSEDYVLDIDNTVKPLYGHQEGAELGYNPQKPGRPSHNYHTYFIGSLRVVLGVEVMAGKKSSGKHSMPTLWRIIDSLPPSHRPRMIRGDVSYGNENGMLEAETRNQPYLFKLRQTTKVKKQIRELECDSEAWTDAGDGWQGTESTLKLMGWTHARRCIFLRRPAERAPTCNRLPPAMASEFSFVEHLKSGPVYEFIVLVTNDDLSIVALSVSVEAVWAIILSVAFVKWLRGKALNPVVQGDQMLLQLMR